MLIYSVFLTESHELLCRHVCTNAKNNAVQWCKLEVTLAIRLHEASRFPQPPEKTMNVIVDLRGENIEVLHLTSALLRFLGVCSALSLWTRGDPWARTLRKGRGRAESALKGWETCPGYLPNPTCLRGRASSPGLSCGRAGIWAVSGGTTEVDVYFLSFRSYFSQKQRAVVEVVGRSLAAARLEFSPVSVAASGCSWRKVQAVNRFLVQSTTRSLQSSLSKENTDKGLKHGDRPPVCTCVCVLAKE